MTIQVGQVLIDLLCPLSSLKLPLIKYVIFPIEAIYSLGFLKQFD